jgi:MOSC domain-containing protein YiiM
MRVISVNTGLPGEIVWRGKKVTTAICKQPMTGRVALRKTNLDGDRQANLTIHGGENKAAYGYPFEHYAYWQGEFPGREFPMGIFGENFTMGRPARKLSSYR